MNKRRIINLIGEVNEMSALKVIMELLNFDLESHSEPISLYINSPGGSIVHGLAIYDTIKHIKAPVYTVCTGLAASMGAFLLSSGKKGNRYAFKHSRILLHQPLIASSTGFAIKESEAKKMADNLEKTRKILEEILAKNTNQDLEKLHKDSERDNWMSSEEALNYGLIDEII